jgi:hypothetical protein
VASWWRTLGQRLGYARAFFFFGLPPFLPFSLAAATFLGLVLEPSSLINWRRSFLFMVIALSHPFDISRA